MTRLIALLFLATSAHALVPRATCISQCAPTIQTTCLNKHHHVKPACKRRLIRQCRHGKPVCLETTTTTVPGGQTTTTTTTTNETVPTTIVTSTTTPTTIGAAQYTMKFTNGPPTGVCGNTDQPTMLHCGGLSIGGGHGLVPEGPTPPGSASLYHLNCAKPSGGQCAISATSVAPSGTDADCTDTGCFFGTPLPVPNGAQTTCVVNTFAKPATGSVDLDTGDIMLDVALKSHVFFNPTGADQPCPFCRTGHCDKGARPGAACQSTNPQGLTRDCPPGGNVGDYVDLGSIDVDLSPLSTPPASKTAGDGNFCPAQEHPGCFQSVEPVMCTNIVEHGSALMLTGSSGPATLASVLHPEDE